MYAEVEVEKSLRSDHEIRAEREAKVLEARKRGEDAQVDLSDITQARSGRTLYNTRHKSTNDPKIRPYF